MMVNDTLQTVTVSNKVHLYTWDCLLVLLSNNKKENIYKLSVDILYYEFWVVYHDDSR